MRHMVRDGSILVGRVRRVPIRAHWTLLLLLFVVDFIPDRSVALPPLLWTLVLVLALLASLIVHELAHCLIAIRFGYRVQSITLILSGGGYQLTRIPSHPYQDAIIAAVGPVTSLVVGAMLYLAYVVSGGWPTDLRVALFCLVWMNLLLGMMNLIPMFPMDGGRLLRAALMAKFSRERATQIVATVGKVCSILLALLGLWAGRLKLMILLPVLAYRVARDEAVQERLRDALERLRIRDLLAYARPPPPVVDAERLAVTVLADMRELKQAELVVANAYGTPVAALRVNDLAKVSADERSTVTLGELAARLPAHHVVVPSDISVNDALERATVANAVHIIVADPAERPDHLVGFVATKDIVEMVKRQMVAKPAPSGYRRVDGEPAHQPRSG